MLLSKLKRLECSLHGEKRKDQEWLEQLLHKEFCEITQSGMLVDRAETIRSLLNEDNVPIIRSSEFSLITAKDNFAILHYRTIDPDGNTTSLRSSCWEISSNGQWKLLFHQGTPASNRV
ncbi:TPA: nuclear transport factor 2 family protein [Citrobacter farmeri]|uniref:nuclear transport factor 2 family protein n=1 Tax=Citrobacter farmeri TaxID=67824 RepID=UPI001E6468EF|nr:nuclear transport factor 2 family protein [Citrobacter farmeri]HCD7254193.1 nuclear transport factor 2 family protein [Citrobacter farmeri]HCD7630662.1 nuclear transport factor 2 family protein [Citrobacter farmeri]HEM7970893.1 nuclear transport factor 2 family protein [Citrobacter farmeri]HEM7985136.1 nuclear transport factor 2 family protein [Citrobacter farmeri]